MAVWELSGFSTEDHGESAVRHREYTTSERRATLFAKIPLIDFSDSGHGIVFGVQPHRGKRKPLKTMKYVAIQMARLRDDEL